MLSSILLPVVVVDLAVLVVPSVVVVVCQLHDCQRQRVSSVISISIFLRLFQCFRVSAATEHPKATQSLYTERKCC